MFKSRNDTPGLSNGFELPGRPWFKHLRAMAAADVGTELVEFAIVVPLLVTLLLGIVWMGRAYNVYQTITRAAREGARYAVLPNSVADGNAFADILSNSCSTDTNAYNDHVAAALRADNLDPAQVLNYCQKTEWLENTYPKQCGVVISFAYPVELAIPFTSLNATSIDIHTSAQMRLENQSSEGTCP
jgi:hypothetical protein